jgi:hypothetical protein
MNTQSNVVEIDAGKDRRSLDEIESRVVGKVHELLPVLIDSYIRSGAKSTMALKVMIQLNRDGETEAVIDGTLSLGSEKETLVGEVLGNQLRFW